MALGPGRYGANAEALLRKCNGDLCIVILIGPNGPAFDVATINPVLLATVPGILRVVATDMEQDIRSDISALGGGQG